MGAEKRLQRVLNKANKGTGNTTEATDNRDEIQEALTASGKGNLVRRGKRLYEKMNKGKGITMVSPLEVGRCWDNYKPNPDGRPASEQGSCVPV